MGVTADLDDPCPVCKTHASSDADYFERAFGDDGRAATGEAFADTLGYCPRHGAFLASRDDLAEPVVQVLLEAVRRTAPLLDPERLHDERVQRVLFPAADACPACRFDEQRMARHAGRIGRGTDPGDPALLCLGHFRLMSRELAPEARMAEMIRYLAVLEEEAEAACARDAERDLRRVAGSLLAAGVPSPEAIDGYSDLPHALGETQACPICVSVALARRRWLASVKHAAELGLDDWLNFPTCPRHVADAVALGEPETTAAIVRHALDGAEAQLQREISVLMATIAEEDVTLRSWRRRRRKKAGEPKVAQPAQRPSRCPACERLEIAREHATGQLLELLAENRHRIAFAKGYGLCMKHFASAWLVAPRGEIRQLLAQTQTERLNDLESRLAGGAAVAGTPAWQAGIYRFCGVH